MSDKRYVTPKTVRSRYGDNGGISAMTLWRWEHNAELGFPKAICINGRRYFDLSQVEDWERKRAAGNSEISQGKATDFVDLASEVDHPGPMTMPAPNRRASSRANGARLRRGSA